MRRLLFIFNSHYIQLMNWFTNKRMSSIYSSFDCVCLVFHTLCSFNWFVKICCRIDNHIKCSVDLSDKWELCLFELRLNSFWMNEFNWCESWNNILLIESVMLQSFERYNCVIVSWVWNHFTVLTSIKKLLGDRSNDCRSFDQIEERYYKKITEKIKLNE
jgi:hypothetical protein